MSVTIKKRKQRTAGHSGVANGYGPVRFILDQEADAFTIPESARTLQGFREWSWSDEFPQEGRISFIDGEIIVDMSKERAECHVKVKTEISRVLSTITMDDDLGEFLSDGSGVTNFAANLSVVPDAVFASWNAFEKGRVRWVPTESGDDDALEMEGSPDWLLEVVSPSSVVKDTVELLRAYHKAGIAEYWLVDARGDNVRFSILRHGATGYDAQPIKKGWQFSPVYGRRFRLTRSKNRLGTWSYRLEVKKGAR